jgi:hypothetical protein
VSWIDDDSRRQGLSQEDKWRIAQQSARMTPEEIEATKRLVDESVRDMQLRLDAIIRQMEGAKK